jgi:uncharacterized membrane protein YdjX (TVP38/TMEM64 family)
MAVIWDTLRRTEVLKAGVLVGVIALVLLVFAWTDASQVLNTEWIDDEVRGHGWRGWLIFVVVGALFTSIGIPRHLASFAAGYAFGFLLGVGVGLFATVLGSAGTFYFGRLVGRRVVPRAWQPRIAAIDRFLAVAPFSMTLIIRFMPIGNNFFTNLVAGVSRVRSPRFLLGTLVGFVPQTTIFALLGSGFRVEPLWRTTAAIVLFVMSTLLSHQVYRRYRRRLAELRDEPSGAEAADPALESCDT